MSVTEYPVAKHVMVEIDIKKVSQHDLLPRWGQYIHGDNLRYIIVDTPLPVILMFWDIRVVRPLHTDSKNCILQYDQVPTDAFDIMHKVSMLAWHSCS